MPAAPIPHDRPCGQCGHPFHHYLPCSDSCDCEPQPIPGIDLT